MDPHEPVAIVGMAGRFPGAPDVEGFWDVLVGGRTAFTRFTEAEVIEFGEDPMMAAHPDYVPVRPVMPDIQTFDEKLFGMTPRQAEVRDPQYRVFLEIAHAALEDAGCDPHSYPGRIGVYAGANGNRYRIDSIEQAPDIVSTVGWEAIDFANWPDYLSTFVSYKLGLRGPSLGVQTACSTSLVAVHQACMALRAGECEMALAGGVDIEMPLNRGYLFVDGGVRARDGVPRPFDRDASGTNFGSGVGAVLLMPLGAARAAGYHVYATVLGSAVNNDGDRKVGFTAPSTQGQAACVSEAIRRAGVDPSTISYVEAHATGTRLGDPIELAALADAFAQTAGSALAAGYCEVGSLKGNIGHLGQAAGVVALIKTALAMDRGVIPGTAHFRTANPEFDLEGTPFFVTAENRDWPRVAGRPRRAGVSSFGIGGTNAHAVLEEAPEVVATDAAPASPLQARGAELVVWSSVEPAADEQLTRRLAGHFAGARAETFADAAHTLRIGRTPRAQRGAVVATGPAEAAELLGAGRTLRAGGRTRDVVFCFPGQGAQYPGIARSLHASEPVFRQGCDQAFEVLRPLLGRDLRELWLTARDPAELAETVVAQPLLYVIEYALAHYLMYLGVRPAKLLGHSLGELVAGAVAGVFGFEDGLRAVAERARLLDAAPAGGMLAVAGEAELVLPFAAGGVTVAAVNGAQQVVLAGPVAELGETADRLRAAGIAASRLAVSRAFHTPAMAGAAAEFEAFLRTLRLKRPRLPLVSGNTGGPVDAALAATPGFWAGQLTEPVRFAEAVDGLLAAVDAPFAVEVGPPVLSGPLRARAAAGERALVTAAALPDARRAGDPRAFPALLGRLWVQGHAVDFERYDAGGGYRRVTVPGYPYQRRRHWIDLPRHRGGGGAAAVRSAADANQDFVRSGPAHGAPPRQGPGFGLAELDWVRAGEPAGEVRSGAVLAVLPAGAEAEPVLAALGDGGQPVEAVRVAGTDVDWRAVFDAAAQAAEPPTLVVLGLPLALPADVGLDDLDSQLAVGLFGLLACARAAAKYQRRLRRPVTLCVLTRHAVDVSGGEPVNPAAGMLIGALRTVAREARGLRCVTVDVGPRPARRALAAELSRLADDRVAVRGPVRWVPRPRLLDAADGDLRGRLRADATYLVTGGLGALGSEVARLLAEVASAAGAAGPRIALVGRTTRPDGDALLDDLRAAGAEVEFFPADVADPVAMREAVAKIEARFGPVSGVVHCAGIASGGLFEYRADEDVRRVLAPKVRGALVLDLVLADQPVEFVVHFSSRAGQAGLLGSADYAAANAFLDAHAHSRMSQRADSAPDVVSAAWPAWAGVGMAAGSPLFAGPAGEAVSDGAADDSARQVVRSLAPDQDWELDEHRVEGVRVLPASAVLELVATTAREHALVPPDAAVDIRELTFTAPIVGDEPVEVRATFRPADGRHDVVVHARHGAGRNWVEHARGSVSAGATSAPPSVDVRALAGGLDSAPPVRLSSWIRFGPRWQVVEAVRERGGEWLAELALPAGFRSELAEHPLHPALIDVATSVSDRAGRDYLPFCYRRFEWYAPLTERIAVHVTRCAAVERRYEMDFGVHDAVSGRVLAVVTGFVLREVRPAELARSLPKAVTAGARAGGAPSGATAVAAPDALPADIGVEALRALLARASWPPHVMVTVPGDEALPAAAAPAAAVLSSPTSPEPGSPAEAPPVAETDPDRIALAIARMCAQTIGVAELGVHDDFFDHGGDSLTAVQLVARINLRWDVEISAVSVFDHSTPEMLAAEVLTLRAPAHREAGGVA